MKKEEILHNHIKAILPEHETPCSDSEWKDMIIVSPHYNAVFKAMDAYIAQQLKEVRQAMIDKVPPSEFSGKDTKKHNKWAGFTNAVVAFDNAVLDLKIIAHGSPLQPPPKETDVRVYSLFADGNCGDCLG